MPNRTNEGRVALVTGSGRGIGNAVARALIATGAKVAVNDLDEERAREAAEALGPAATAFPADVSSSEQVKSMVESVHAALGPIDFLVNNAGMDRAAPIEDIEEDEWDRFMAVNLKSVYLCSRTVLPTMKKRRFGRIVSMSSIVAHQGAMNGGIHYATTKAGILGFTRTLARQMAPYNITANAIAPGVVDTDLIRENMTSDNRARIEKMIPRGRLATPDDIGQAVAYLVSPSGDYVTGATLNVNGGIWIG